MAKGSRNAYIAVLGVAGLALVGDRVFLGGPKAAGADVAAAANDLLIKPAGPAMAVREAASDTAATRLARFAAQPWAPADGDLGEVVDWLRPPPPSPEEAKRSPNEPPPKPWPERFQISGYTRGASTGVTVSRTLSETGGANKDTFVTIGKTFEGMVLSEIDLEKGVAVFTGGGKRHELPIKGLPRKLSSENTPRDPGTPR